MKEIVPERVFEYYLKATGYTWTLQAPGQTDLEVWKEDDGRVLIRQENDGQVDLIGINEGQAYDLLKALARALEV